MIWEKALGQRFTRSFSAWGVGLGLASPIGWEEQADPRLCNQASIEEAPQPGPVGLRLF